MNVDSNLPQYLTNEKAEASWVKLRSVTGQSALDEFLSTAELAGTDFTAEKSNNTRVIHPDQRDPFLPTETEERATARRQAAHRGRITVPRRPPWDSGTSKAQLEAREREALLEWRRGLADLTENHDLLVTPFERNLEVWRQLWRVVERSDLLVQIVDARDPLLFRSEDLEKYVKEVEARKRNLLLVNKADLLTRRQREAWADYFNREGIHFKFFSARTASDLLEADSEVSEQSDHGEEDSSSDAAKDLPQEVEGLALQEPRQDSKKPDEGSDATNESSRSRILTLDELEALFMANIPTAPEADTSADTFTEPSSTTDSAPNPPATDSTAADSTTTAPRKATIGLVGYPNVGKSSTINALLGAKKVSVSATPGKTKHFQTLHLSPSLILCDCPGLVLPNFAATAAELVCAGVLPVDQQRELRGPAALVARRIPRSTLEAMYGVRIPVRPVEEGGTGVPSASELLAAYARARGFATSGSGGRPDESRAARFVLKDYVNGRLPWCHPPPMEPPTDPRVFNAELYHEFQTSRSAGSRGDASAPPAGSGKARRVDDRFFQPGSGGAGHLSSPFGYVERGRGGGKAPTGRKERLLVAMERGVDPSEVRLGNGKRHFKGRRARGGAKEIGGYDEG